MVVAGEGRAASRTEFVSFDDLGVTENLAAFGPAASAALRLARLEQDFLGG